MPIDRDDPATARAIMTNLFPIDRERLAVMNQLLISVNSADAIAPNAWSVTLFEDAFRVNAGQVEVFKAYAGGFFLNCSASMGVSPFDTNAVETAKYSSVAQPQCRVVGAPHELENLHPDIQRAHLRFVALASRSPSGKPRAGTSLRKSHSEGLLKYARSVVDDRGMR